MFSLKFVKVFSTTKFVKVFRSLVFWGFGSPFGLWTLLGYGPSWALGPLVLWSIAIAPDNSGFLMEVFSPNSFGLFYSILYYAVL